MQLNHLGEFGLIERWNQQIESRPEVLLGIGDDAAILAALQQPVVTCDALVEGVHFRLDWTTPRALGNKAMAVNVSDIAAMGAQPIAAFITIALPAHLNVEFLDELYAGFNEAARDWNFTIAGGDTTRSPRDLFFSITMIGAVPENRAPLRRSGAKHGDAVLVTGTVGDAAAGLAILNTPPTVSHDDHAFLLERHFSPTPRLREIESVLGGILSSHIHAAIDLSDGIAGDATHIAKQSELAIDIEPARLPVSDACRRLAAEWNRPCEQWTLYGGEDFELLLCVAPEFAEEITNQIELTTGTAVTQIGHCHDTEAERGQVFLVHEDGRRQKVGAGWTHF